MLSKLVTISAFAASAISMHFHTLNFITGEGVGEHFDAHKNDIVDIVLPEYPDDRELWIFDEKHREESEKYWKVIHDHPRDLHDQTKANRHYELQVDVPGSYEIELIRVWSLKELSENGFVKPTIKEHQYKIKGRMSFTLDVLQKEAMEIIAEDL